MTTIKATNPPNNNNETTESYPTPPRDIDFISNPQSDEEQAAPDNTNTLNNNNSSRRSSNTSKGTMATTLVEERPTSRNKEQPLIATKADTGSSSNNKRSKNSRTMTIGTMAASATEPSLRVVTATATVLPQEYSTLLEGKKLLVGTPCPSSSSSSGTIIGEALPSDSMDAPLRLASNESGPILMAERLVDANGNPATPSTPDSQPKKETDQHTEIWVGKAKLVTPPQTTITTTAITPKPTSAEGNDAPPPRKPAPKRRKAKTRVSRPLNSFMIFSNEQRALLRAQHPDYDNKVISKMLGERWAALGTAGKAKYYDQARELAEKHKVEHPEWKFTRNTKKRKAMKAAMEAGMINSEKSSINSDAQQMKREPNYHQEGKRFRGGERVLFPRNEMDTGLPSYHAATGLPGSPYPTVGNGQHFKTADPMMPYMQQQYPGPGELSESQAERFSRLARMQLHTTIRHHELLYHANTPPQSNGAPPPYLPPPPIDHSSSSSSA